MSSLPRFLILLVLACALACGGDDPAPAEPATEAASTPATPDVQPIADGERPPAILVVFLDTTSPMAIREHMPNAQAFLDGSRRYDRAIAPSNSTMETVAGVFAGTWLSAAKLFDPGYTTLPEALKQRGYSTYLNSANPVLNHPFYHRGFDQQYTRVAGIQRDFPDQGVVEAFLPWWESEAGPKFAWIQLAACHDYRVAGKKDYVSDGWAHGEAELAEAWEAYGLDCAATDELLPRVLASNPGGVTVVTADHGELFAQHGTYALPSQAQHGHGVSDSPLEIHVPLGIQGPGFERGSDPTLVSLIDLRATLLRVAGVQVEGGDLRTGADLTPAIAASCDVYDDPLRHFSVRVREDGTHVLRTTGLSDVPELAAWTPGDAPGLQPLRALKPRDLDDVEKTVLFGAAQLTCVDDKDICAAHPELASLGYVDCP